MNSQLLVLVHRAFDRIDKRGTNAIDPQDLIANFNYENHPDVVTKKRSGEDVLKEFLDTFDVGGVIPEKVTRDEFVNYYTNMNASINDDDYMEVILRRSWSLGETAYNSKSKNDSTKNENSLLSRIRNAQDFGNQSANFNPPPPATQKRPFSASATGTNNYL